MDPSLPNAFCLTKTGLAGTTLEEAFQLKNGNTSSNGTRPQLQKDG
jgi:hypothetical protein